jgi:RNA recognition motif-containing protein
MGTRLYVGNLSFSSTSETVREAFARIGEVTDVHIVTDRTSGQSRGFGFVTMGTPAEAQKAIEAMNGATLDGRPLRVNEALVGEPAARPVTGDLYARGGHPRWPSEAERPKARSSPAAASGSFLAVSRLRPSHAARHDRSG